MGQSVFSQAPLPSSHADDVESEIAVHAASLRTLCGNFEERILELRRSNEGLKEFAYVAAHDLQSPLRTVCQFAELLRHTSQDGLGETRENYINMIVESTSRMAELISDLLKYAQVLSSDPPEELVEAGAAVDLALINLSLLILEANAIVSHDVLPAVQVCSAHLLQMFQNLVENAIRYRGTERLHVHISAIEEKDDYLFSIRDNGIGIDAQYRECIFEPFKRLHGAERSGNGLGLAVCRQIVERAGGRIWVESEVGTGSTFYFKFPKQFRGANENSPATVTCERKIAAHKEAEANRRKVRDALEEQASSLQQANQELLAEKKIFQMTLACIGDAVITTDKSGTISYLNPVAEALSGWSNSEALGMPSSDIFNIFTEVTRTRAEDPVVNCLRSGEVTRLDGDTLLIRRDGRELSIDDTAAPIINAAKETIGAVLIFRDVGDKRQLVQQLSHQAIQDALTGLENRRGFERRMKHVLDYPEAHEPDALLYLDLDQFKVVNDMSGHAAGDMLLRQLGALMLAHIRPGDSLARLGGDEFGVLLEKCPKEQAQGVANHLRETIANFRFEWEGKIFTIGASIGVVPIPQTGGTLSDLFVAADAACYAAKERGGNRVYVYELDDSTLLQRQGEMQWVGRINTALRKDHFCLYYQPIVPLRGNRARQEWGEILLRLLDEENQLILPGQFAPPAEHYGLMTTVDRWVFRHALDALRFRGSSPAPVIYSINISGQSLGDENFLSFVMEELRRTEVHPAQVCIEITETAAIANLSHAIRFISVLKELGCVFALDDFGTGLSSFAYLRSLPVDYVKVAGPFVKNMTVDPIDHAMVQAIHHIGGVMGIQTIAEHVEDGATLEALKTIGVEYAQGNMLGRPLALEAKVASI